MTGRDLKMRWIRNTLEAVTGSDGEGRAGLAGLWIPDTLNYCCSNHTCAARQTDRQKAAKERQTFRKKKKKNMPRNYNAIRHNLKIGYLFSGNGTV